MLFTTSSINDNKQLHYLLLYAINLKKVTSDGYLCDVCHSAYYMMLSTPNAVSYSVTNSIADYLLVDMKMSGEIKAMSTYVERNNYLGIQDDYYHLTLHGAWMLFKELKTNPINLDIFRQYYIDAESSIFRNDNCVSELYESAFGPFISLENIYE